MANLRVDKITSTETFETTGSVQFDGPLDGGGIATNHIVVSSSSDFDFGTGDFTFEVWAYSVGWDGGESNKDQVIYYHNDEPAGFFVRAGVLYYYNGGYMVTGPTLEESKWYHLAAVRKDQILTLYVDGKSVGSAVNSVDYATSAITIGKNSGNNKNQFRGHLSNFRVLNKALYTANFKPPMRELEVIPGTVLLCCQSKTDASLEKTGKTLTVTLAVASELTPGILTPVPKAGAGSAITGSVEFDGTGDCLTAPDGSDFEFGSDNFTIEAYIYYTGSPGTSGDTYVITSKWDNQSAPNDKGFILRISDDGSGDNLQWFYTTDGSTNDITTGSTILIPESWYHIAFVRNGTTGTFYINGIADATTVSFGSDSIRDTGNPFRIGANLESGAIDQEFQGFISNLRVIKGTALYTDDFIPPTRELKKVPGTVLLCCQDPDSPLTEATGKTITPYGSLGDGGLGSELVTSDGVWALTKGGSGATDWTVSNNGSSLVGTTVTSGFMRATYTLDEGDY